MFAESDYCPKFNRHQGGGTKIFPAEDYILVFLYFAGNKTSYRQVSEIFGIAESTVFKIINAVMDFLVEKAPLFIKFPSTTAGKEALAEEFFQVHTIAIFVPILNLSWYKTTLHCGVIPVRIKRISQIYELCNQMKSIHSY